MIPLSSQPLCPVGGRTVWRLRFPLWKRFDSAAHSRDEAASSLIASLSVNSGAGGAAAGQGEGRRGGGEHIRRQQRYARRTDPEGWAGSGAQDWNLHWCAGKEPTLNGVCVGAKGFWWCMKRNFHTTTQSGTCSLRCVHTDAGATSAE